MLCASASTSTPAAKAARPFGSVSTSRAAAIVTAASRPASSDGATTLRTAGAMFRSWAITSRYITEAPARLALRSR